MGTISIDSDAISMGHRNLRAMGDKPSLIMTGSFAFDSSYPTNGESFDLSAYMPKGVIGVMFEPQDGYIFRYDATNKKVLAYEPLTTPTGTVSQPTFSGTVTQPTFTASNITAKSVSLDCGSTACSNTDSENSDSASDITSADAVATYSAVADAAWSVGAITNPTVPRNIAITIRNDSGGPLNLYEGVMTFTVTGTDYKGEALTEDITFTSEAGNKAVATANYRFKFGNKAFATVTDITLDNVPDNDLDIGVGFGGKISFLGELTTPDTGDVLQIIEDGTVVADPSSNIDTTNMTYNFDAIAADKVVSMTYLVTNGATGTVSQPTVSGTVTQPTFSGNEVATHAEADNGDDLSDLDAVKFVAWGY